MDTLTALSLSIYIGVKEVVVPLIRKVNASNAKSTIDITVPVRLGDLTRRVDTLESDFRDIKDNMEESSKALDDKLDIVLEAIRDVNLKLVERVTKVETQVNMYHPPERQGRGD